MLTKLDLNIIFPNNNSEVFQNSVICHNSLDNREKTICDDQFHDGISFQMLQNRFHNSDFVHSLKNRDTCLNCGKILITEDAGNGANAATQVAQRHLNFSYRPAQQLHLEGIFLKVNLSP